MGFGILFVGYIFLIYSISFADLLGYLVMIVAAKKLSSYIDGFLKTLPVLYALAAVSLLDSAASLTSLVFGGSDTILAVTGTVADIAAVLNILLSVLFYVFLLRAIADIAKEVALFRVEKWARINLVCSVIATASGLFNLLSAPLVANDAADPVLSVIFGAVPIALNIVIVILNGALIYTCYMRICLPSEQDITLPPKESKKRTPLFHRPLDEDEAEVERLFEEKQEQTRRAQTEKRKNKKRS